MQSIALQSLSESHTICIAATIATKLTAPALILLEGDLGAGKTTFVKGFVGALSNSEQSVKSPTYALMHTYQTQPVVHHFDLYRMHDAQTPLSVSSLEEWLYDVSAFALVEWPTKDLQSMVPHWPTLCIQLQEAQKVQGRKMVIEGPKEMISALQLALFGYIYPNS